MVCTPSATDEGTREEKLKEPALLESKVPSMLKVTLPDGAAPYLAVREVVMAIAAKFDRGTEATDRATLSVVLSTPTVAKVLAE